MPDMLKQNDLFDDEIFVLIDDDGKENEFALLGSVTIEDQLYLALTPADDEKNPDDEYIILKPEIDENGDEVLSTIEDDEEFDRVAEIFDDQLFGEDEAEEGEASEEDGGAPADEG